MEMREYSKKAQEILGVDMRRLMDINLKIAEEIHLDADIAESALLHDMSQNRDIWDGLSQDEKTERMHDIMQNVYDERRNSNTTVAKEMGNLKKYSIASVYHADYTAAYDVYIEDNKYTIIYGNYKNKMKDTFYCSIVEYNWSAEIKDPDSVDYNANIILDCVRDKAVAKEIASAIQFQYAYRNVWNNTL